MGLLQCVSTLEFNPHPENVSIYESFYVDQSIIAFHLKFNGLVICAIFRLKGFVSDV